MIKLAFIDSDSGEYYVCDDFDKFEFSDDPEKAKLYFHSPRLEESFEYVQHNSKRNLGLVDMEVTVSFINQSTYFDELKKKRKEEFEELNVLAEQDLDGMEESSYKRWRKLKKEFEVKNV